MKTHLKWSAILYLLFEIVLPWQAQSALTNAATISGQVILRFPGRTANLPWGLRHTGSVSGLQFDLSYPSDKLSAGVFQQGTLSNNVAFRWRQIAPGQHRVLFYTKGVSTLATNVSIGSLPMTIPAGDYTGGGRITVTNAIVSRTNALAALPLGLAHGGLLSTPIFRGEDGVVDLLLVVQSNHVWVVQATTNFVNWVNIETNFATFDYVAATDEDAPNFQKRFYRAMLVGSGAGGQISRLNLLSGGSQLTFGYATIAGKTYVLQASTNLTSWNSLTTNLASGSLLNFTNSILPGVTKEFFRVLELP